MRMCAIGFCVAALALAGSGAPAAGPIDPPPGPVSPTGRTLITSLPWTINGPGVYYLAGNLSMSGPGNGITVSASGVTIDLGGFEIDGNGGPESEVAAISAGSNRIEVVNGSISGWFACIVTTGAGCRFTDLNLGGFSSKGSMGIHAGHDAAVTRCTVDGFGGGGGVVVGDGSVLTDCAATGGIGDGLRAGSHARILRCRTGGIGYEASAQISAGPWSWVQDCVVTHASSSFDSIRVGSDSTVLGCVIGGFNIGPGVVAGDRCLVRSCRVKTDYSTGISVGSGGTVTECYVAYGEPAIRLSGDGCLARDNHVSLSEVGVRATGTGHFVARNVIGAGTPLDIAPGSIVGPLISMPGGGTITATNPWANFSW